MRTIDRKVRGMAHLQMEGEVSDSRRRLHFRRCCLSSSSSSDLFANRLRVNVYAHMWFNIAASQGDENAAKLRDIIAERMPPSQIAEAQKLARECVRKNYKDC